MKGFLLGAFSRNPQNHYANYIEDLYRSVSSNSCVYVKTSLQDNMAFNIVCYPAKSQRVFTQEDETILILCFGTEINVSLLETIQDYYLANQLNKIKAINAVFTTLIIDKNQAKIVLLADRLGTMPLYYHLGTDNDLLFASEMKGIIASSNFTSKLNTKILFELFHTGFIQAPDTLIESIASLGTTKALHFDGHLRLETTHIKPMKETGFVSAPDKMLACLTTSLQNNIKGQDKIGIMCSGGFDSALIVALLKRITPKELTLFTLYTDKENAEYQNTFKLQALFNTQNLYFKPEAYDMLQHIEDSLWCGESETVGALSVNIALEYAFAKFTHSATVIFTGDAFLTSADIAKQSPGFYAANYGMLDQTMTQSFLYQWPTSKLHYLIKYKNVIHGDDLYTSHKINRLETRGVLIGTLNGKIREAANANQALYMPFMDDEFVHYIEQMQLHYPETSDYRKLMKAMVSSFGLLPENALLKTKDWMPSVLDQLQEDGILDEFINKILTPTSLCQRLFGENIASVMRSLGKTQRYKLIMTLYYLERFHEIFILQQADVLEKLKDNLKSLTQQQNKRIPVIDYN